jgi:hypothetical protein
MKTEDELDDEIAKIFDEVTTTKVEMVNGKPRISDEQTLLEMDFATACEAMVEAERRFQRVAEQARKQEGVPKNMVEWFDALESRYLTDKRLWELFTGSDRSVRSNKMYNEYRLMLLRGETTRPDA